MEEEKGLVVMSMKVRPEILEHVKYLAKQSDLTTSRFLSNLMEVVLPDLLIGEKVGVFKMAILLRDLKSTMRSWANNIEYEPEHVGECE